MSTCLPTNPLATAAAPRHHTSVLTYVSVCAASLTSDKAVCRRLCRSSQQQHGQQQWRHDAGINSSSKQQRAVCRQQRSRAGGVAGGSQAD